MVSAAILLTAALSLGQISASDGPPRQWLPAVVGGRTVYLWGWRDASGGVGYRPDENAHVFKPARPTPAVPQLSPGQTISADGAINNGLMLQATRPTGTLETNDPDLARKLERRCPGPGPCPPDEPDPTIPDLPLGPNPLARLEEYSVPIVCLICALLLVVFASRRNASVVLSLPSTPPPPRAVP